MTWPLLAASVSLVVSLLLLRGLLRWGSLPLDRPNARSLHGTPVPRGGGVGILAGLLAAQGMVAALVPAWLAPWGLLAPALFLAGVSFLDDRRSVGLTWRLLAQVLAAAVLLAFGLDHPPTGVAWWGLLVLVVWATNLYNFMDGLDGLAGGMTGFGFLALASMAWLAGDPGLAAFCLALVAAAVGFLVYNFPPARLFMGDVGAVPLGFLAAGVSLVGWQRGLWSPCFPLVVFSPFVVDATVTLARRLVTGQIVWQAHKSHYYQRLNQLGWGHNRTVMAEYGLMVACAATALFAEYHGMMAMVTGIWGLVYLALMGGVDAWWRARPENTR